MPYAHLRFTFRRDGVASVEQGSGGVPAGSDPGSIGWVRPTGSEIHCVDTGDTYKFDGSNWDQELNVNSTFQDAASAEDLVSETVTAPAIDTVGGVHAGFAGNDVSNDFPGAFTNPDVPRSLSFTFGVGWDGGAVTPVGTDMMDAPCTEVIADPGAGGAVVQATKVYKTVTAATKGAAGANPATCSIDTWHKLGLLNSPDVANGTVSADGVTEPATFEQGAQMEGFLPTTLPDGAVDYVATFAKAGATSVVTATP